MACPHPLDPLCVAIMLRLSSGRTPTNRLSADLQVNSQTVNLRLQRLKMLGAVTHISESDSWALRDGAHQWIMEISSTGLNQNTQTRTSVEEANLAARLARLKDVELFKTLPPDELDWLAR